MRTPIKHVKHRNPDVKYDNLEVYKLINYVMHDGEKSIAQRIVYAAFDIVAEETKQDPLEVFKLAMANVEPALEIKTQRIGGANYQIPFPVRPERKIALALRWILEASRSKKGQPMAKKLAAEIIAASKEEGNAVRKKNDTQRMAEANRAFAHFAQ
jgi:small subunit ribosomal protein S7